MHALSEKPPLLIAVGVALLFLCVICRVSQAAASPQLLATILVKNDATSSEIDTGAAILKGRWRRPDGSYVIVIGAVDSTGKMDAAYFNPNPIKVSKAEATREGGAINVFIELQDTGYPGCTYTLTYDPQTDQMRGVYFQAAIQQKFDVIFLRIK
jgi:hypothetical protein